MHEMTAFSYMYGLGGRWQEEGRGGREGEKERREDLARCMEPPKYFKRVTV